MEVQGERSPQTFLVNNTPYSKMAAVSDDLGRVA